MDVNCTNQNIKITTFITKLSQRAANRGNGHWCDHMYICMYVCTYIANGHCYYFEIAPLHKVFLNK